MIQHMRMAQQDKLDLLPKPLYFHTSRHFVLSLKMSLCEKRFHKLHFKYTRGILKEIINYFFIFIFQNDNCKKF